MSYNPEGSKWPLILLVVGALGLAGWFAYKRPKGVGRGRDDSKAVQGAQSQPTHKEQGGGSRPLRR